MVTETTFHACRGGPVLLVCDRCGSLVDNSDRSRLTHQQWHDQAAVIDLTAREQEPADS